MQVQQKHDGKMHLTAKLTRQINLLDLLAYMCLVLALGPPVLANFREGQIRFSKKMVI